MANVARENHPLKLIRVISDGRPGHENQSVGLALALSRRTGADVETVRLPTRGSLWSRRLAALQVLTTAPQLIVGAGHKVHLPLWFAARRFDARSVVIMEPTWPKRLFDVCIRPEHDSEGEPVSPRIITTLGALNRLPETAPAKQSKGVILIGGPSKSHGWNGAVILDALQEIVVARPELEWTLSDSRRTPSGFLDELRARLPQVSMLSHQQTEANWVPSQLMSAEEVWVTGDSVSMVFEAVTAGARTGILPVPIRKPAADPIRAMQRLVRDGYATDYESWRVHRELPPPKPLHETGKCADEVLARLFPGK